MTPEQIAAKLTQAQVRAIQGKRGYTDWLNHCSSVRTDTRTAIVRKGIWEEFKPKPHGLLCLRFTPLGRAALAELDKRKAK